MEVNIAEGASG